MDILIEKVQINSCYPDGIRFRFILLNNKTNKTRYLVDNYNNHGPHEHPIYHIDRNKRVPLHVKNQSEAKEKFFDVIEAILLNEK